MKKILCSFTAMIALAALPAMAADAQPPIKIGYINAYTGVSFAVLPNQKGTQLAINEINAKGGVLGRPLELESRDSKMDPGEAVRLAEELRTRDKVDVLMNCDASGTSTAVDGWVKQNHVPFVISCSEADSTIWQYGNEYVARINSGAYGWVEASLEKAQEMYGDKLKNKRWVTIAPSIEFGHYIVQTAKDVATSKGWNPTWVGEQWPAYDKLSAGSTLTSLDRMNPDVVFVALYGTDVVKFVREAKKRDFIKNRIIIFPSLAVPEHLDMLGQELPKGWFSVGYPLDEVRKKNPELDTFAKAYQAAYHEPPTVTYAASGYNAIQAIAAAIRKAGSTDPEKIKVAFDDLRFNSTYGEETLRKLDHQASVPFWVGISDISNGVPKISDWKEYNMKDVTPSDDAILKMRGGR